MVKSLPASAGDTGRRYRFIPGLERCLGGGNGKPLQYSFLEDHVDRGAWQGPHVVHGDAKSWTCLTN